MECVPDGRRGSGSRRRDRAPDDGLPAVSSLIGAGSASALRQGSRVVLPSSRRRLQPVALFEQRQSFVVPPGDRHGHVPPELTGGGFEGQSDSGMPRAASSSAVAGRPFAQSTTSGPVTHAEPVQPSTTAAMSPPGPTGRIRTATPSDNVIVARSSLNGRLILSQRVEPRRVPSHSPPRRRARPGPRASRRASGSPLTASGCGHRRYRTPSPRPRAPYPPASR